MTHVGRYLCVRACCGWLAWALATLPGLAFPQADPAPASSQEALIVYGDAANFQNNGKFALAAEEWNAFLERFPDDPLAAKAQHYAGVCQLQLKQFDKAAEAFAKVIQNYPDSDLVQEAYLNRGWCQYSLAGQGTEGMHAQAAATFTEMISKFPQGKFTDQALFFLGEAEYAQGNAQQAAVAYQKLVKGFPESKLRCDALYALGVALEERQDYASAGKVYDVFLKEFAKDELATEVRMRKAETLLQTNQLSAADAMFREVAAVEGFASADHAVYRRGFCLSKSEKFAEAAEIYKQLVEAYPDSVYVAEATAAAGRSYYRAKKWSEARDWLQRVVDAGGEDAVEAAHWLCRIHLQDNEPGKVIQLAEAILPKAGGSLYRVQLLMDQADAMYEQDADKAKAVELYLQIVKEAPDSEVAPQAAYNAAFAALELKQLDAARQRTEAFLKAYPGDRLVPDVMFVAAEAELLKGEYAEAAKTFDELLAQYPEHPERETWQVRQGLSRYLQKQYGGVIEALGNTAGEMKVPDNRAEAQFLIGASQFYQNQEDAAIAALNASLEASPNWRQADETKLVLSRAQRRKGQIDQALETITQVIENDPDSSLLDQAYYRLGEYKYAKEDYAGALEAYRKVPSTWPKSSFAPYAQYGIAWSQFKSKSYGDAVGSFTTLITDHPEHPLIPDARFGRAMCRRQVGEFAEAVADIDAYLQTEPNAESAGDALYEKGLCLVPLKQYDDAADTFQKVLETNPQYAAGDKVLYEIGWARKSKDSPESDAQAVQAFSRLADEYPDSPLAAEASFHVGEARYAQEKYADAADAYRAAADKSRDVKLQEKSLYKLGWSQFQQKQYDEALQAFSKQAKQYAEGDFRADALFMIAECSYRQEDYEQALPAFQKALETELPSETLTVLALLHAGQSASQQKQWAPAIEWLKQIPEKYPESPSVPEAYYELGWAQQNASQEAEALKAFEQAADRGRLSGKVEVSARARFMLGELYFQQQEFAKAITEFQRVIYGYGSENAPENVKPWQAKAGFEAARCAEVQIDVLSGAEKQAKIKESKDFYQYVVDTHPQDDLAEKSQTRLQALSRM